MPRYRIHRIKEAAGESFRWAAHTGGLAIIKPKDYEFDQELELEAATPYAAWKALAADEKRLRPGDVLESFLPEGSTQLFIAKYVGFEPAQWLIPEGKAERAAITSVFEPSASATASETLR